MGHKNFHRFNNDVLAREVFVSSFRRKDKSKDEEQQKRALLFAGINFWWMDFWDEDAFKETFKDEISKEESNLLDQNSIHKIIEDFGIHIDDCSTEQWLNFFMRNGIAIPDLLDISPTTWNVSHFDDESVSAHLYISSKGVTYTSEVIENCKLTPNIITKILLTLLDESTISSSCQEFLCNFLDQSDLETYCAVAVKLCCRLSDSPNQVLNKILENFIEVDDIVTLGDRLIFLAEAHEYLPSFIPKIDLFFESSDSVEQQSKLLNRLILFKFEGVNKIKISTEQTCAFDYATFNRLYNQHEVHKHLCVEAITASFLREKKNPDGPNEFTYRLIADVLENLEKQDAKFQFSDVEKYRTWLKYLTRSIIFRKSLEYFSHLRSQRRSTFAKMFRGFYDDLDKKINY